MWANVINATHAVSAPATDSDTPATARAAIVAMAANSITVYATNNRFRTFISLPYLPSHLAAFGDYADSGVCLLTASVVDN